MVIVVVLVEWSKHNEVKWSKMEGSEEWSGVKSGMKSWVKSGMKSGMKSGVKSGMKSGVESGKKSGMKSGVKSGEKSEVMWNESGLKWTKRCNEIVFLIYRVESPASTFNSYGASEGEQGYVLYFKCYTEKIISF